MIEVYATAYGPTNGQSIVFASKALQTGITATIDSTNTTIELNRPGIYRVDFNATGATTATGTIGAQLLANGSAVARALAEANTAAGEAQTISFSTLVAVGPTVIGQKAALTVEYTGGAGVLDLANLIVTKIA